MSKYIFYNCKLLDGSENMQVQEDKAIIVEDDKITNIIDEKDLSLFSGFEMIDLKGKYIMPGLINLHVHIPGSGKPKMKQSDTAKLVKFLTSTALTRFITYKVCQGFLKPELFSGVTTLRSVGGVMAIDGKLRDKVYNGKVIGPRILAGNTGVSVPGGHMAGSLTYIVTTPEEATEITKKIVDSKPDLVKLMITGGVLDAKKRGEPGALKMSPEIVKAVTTEAHKNGLMCAAHVESTEGVKVALENGVDTIEHGAVLTEHEIELFKKTGAKHVATISPALPYALFDREITHATDDQQYNGNIIFKGIISCANTCLKEGIPVGIGTDTGCPYITHYDMWREVFYFHKYCNVSNAFALYTATLGNAKIVGIDNITGSITAGKSADMIVTKDNPLDSLTALRNVDMVMCMGRLYKHPKVKKMAVCERELDKFLNE